MQCNPKTKAVYLHHLFPIYCTMIKLLWQTMLQKTPGNCTGKCKKAKQGWFQVCSRMVPNMFRPTFFFVQVTSQLIFRSNSFLLKESPQSLNFLIDKIHSSRLSVSKVTIPFELKFLHNSKILVGYSIFLPLHFNSVDFA